MQRSEALSALQAKQDAEAQMARAATCPLWRHIAFALLMAGLVATPGLDLVLRFAVLAIILGCIPLIIRSDRKRTGMFISGYRKGKTRLVTIGILVIELGLYAVSVVRALDHADHSTPFLLGAVGFVIAIAGSFLWQHVFVREMAA